jgi:simple sugar transport system permease protein
MDTPTTNPTDPSKSPKGLAARLKLGRLETQTLLLLGVFIVLMIFFSLSANKFLTGRSITSMAFQLPEIGVLTLAMMITIITGGINLSVNATSNLAAVLAGLFMLKFIPENASEGQITLIIALALLIALLVGFLCGVLNGFLVGRIGVPPILATLATMTFFTGISTGITGGATVTGFPEQLSSIGNGDILGIPIPFIIFVALTFLTYVLLFRTTFGFKLRMLGSNPTASNFSGIDNKDILMKVYIVSGLFSAVTGILIMSRTMSAAIEYGTTTYVLLTILITVLANILPGFGNVLNIFIAVLILQILSTGFHMILAGVRGSSFFKDFSWGMLLILIFIINYFARRRKVQE